MSDLAEFLLARITEDTAAVTAKRTFTPITRVVCACGQQGVISGGNWTDPYSVRVQHDDGAVHDLAHKAGRAVWDQLPISTDGRRRVAECEAKRRIIEEHRPDRESLRCGCCWLEDLETWEPYPCPTLRLLALPYAGHPDYREEWRL